MMMHAVLFCFFDVYYWPIHRVVCELVGYFVVVIVSVDSVS